MARSKPSARDALRKLREQREELDAKEARLRREAATELGNVLIECGAETIEPAALRQLIRQSMTLGVGQAPDAPTMRRSRRAGSMPRAAT